MVLLPDSWTLPAGLSFTAGMSGFTNNKYTAEQWAEMEAAGAVFLPAVGSRGGTDVYSVGSYGYYWSSTAFGTSGACSLDFFDSGAYADYYDRGNGRSVRLVRVVQ